MNDLAPVKLTFGESIGIYGKSLGAAVVAVLSAYTTALQDGDGVSMGEVFVIIGAFFATGAAVWAVPNVPDKVRRYGKLITAGVLVVVSSLATAATDGSLSQTEVINALIALIGALVVTGGVSNAASSDPVDAKGHVIAIPTVVKDEIATEGPTQVEAVGQVVVVHGPRRAAEDAMIVVEDEQE